MINVAVSPIERDYGPLDNTSSKKQVEARRKKK
jgi:hypothetical protein